MLVIGTAGHIDHGKSAIVTRLTGTDPDRLPEEKSRGMTIDLGFAFRETSRGDTLAFIDVPGHERFVKNMIAGAGGIDVVMLVVAADDGWMPQSEEHFHITRLLGVTRGLIVINKIDLVEKDWLELQEQEIAEKVAGSFLAGAPIFRVSAATGEGFEALERHLDSLSDDLEGKRDIGKARLYIDRSFVRPGMGSVVTGTLKGGVLEVGQSVGVWPGDKAGKIRTLQSNNQEVLRAQPGQRTAISFTGLEREDLGRGGVVSARTDLSYFSEHPVMVLSLAMLSDAQVKLTDRRRVLCIVGTTEVEGEVRVLDASEIAPGGSGVLFFRPDNPVYALIGDYFILRLPTPMVTLGGGRVIDHLEQLPRRKYYGEFGYLKQRLNDDLSELIVSEVSKRILVAASELLEEAAYSRHQIAASTKGLLTAGRIKQFHTRLYNPETVATFGERVKAAIKDSLSEKSHLGGVTIDMLARSIRLPVSIATSLVDYLVEHGMLMRTGETYNVAGEGVVLSGDIKVAYDDILRELAAQPYDPVTLTQLAARGKAYRQAIKYLVDTGQAYKCGSVFLFLPQVWRGMVEFMKAQIQANGKLMVGDLKDKFGFSRKFAIPILEEVDRLGVTKRDGDARVRGDRFEG